MTTPPASGQTRRPRWARALKWTAISLAVIVLLGAGGVVADYYYLTHRIHHDPYVIPSGQARPAKIATKAENFVLIGSDTRAGANGNGTGGSSIAGARSDTTIILHISANGAGASLISIPRDSWVQIPACVIGPHNELSTPQMDKFNAAYSIGGTYSNKFAASCTVHTIETLTGVHIDHYAVIDFVGFEKMVEALGGVRMCVATRLYDPIVDDNGAYHGSGLNLPAGKNVEIDGAQALALMRARYNLDGGGDLPRIKRQQEFVAAMIRKATSSGLLIHPLKLQSFLEAATGALTTDGFGLGTMRKLASALHSAGAGSVRLLTVPNLQDQPGLPYGDVEWDPSKAPELWNDIRHDLPLPGTQTKSSTATPSPSPTPTQSGPPLSVAPSSISVNVENGTALPGLAHTVATKLEAQGFHVLSVGDAPKQNYVATTVEYGPDRVQSSQTVQESIPGSFRHADSTAGDVITVIVGSDFTKVIPVTLSNGATTTPTPTPSPSIDSFSAADKGCLS